MTIQARHLTLNHQLRRFGHWVTLSMIRSTPQRIEVWTRGGLRLDFHPSQQVEAQCPA